MRTVRFALFVVLAAAGFVVATAGASAASAVVGHVYVDDNTAGVNTVAGFDRHADGTLTALRGSPFGSAAPAPDVPTRRRDRFS